MAKRSQTRSQSLSATKAPTARKATAKARDRLATYRGKRDFSRTSEPRA